jgi:L-ascorbate oxidase
MISWLASGLLLAAARFAVGDESNASSPISNNGSHLHKHDGGFTPDFYLSVTYENHTVACQHHMSVLVNRTSPGPTLRLPAGKTSWVRVCNNMDEYNTTMVELLHTHFATCLT